MEKNIERKEKMYQRLIKQISEHIYKTEDIISKMSTIISILHNKIPYYFWTGFYFLKNDKLIVGPYQGSLACLILPKPKGVCWKAVINNESIIVPDVHKFEDHIACDARSNSEIVIPLHNSNDYIYGVFDIDSKNYDAFDSIDKKYLEEICNSFLKLPDKFITTSYNL
ncbi:MAG: GAF domain-containing protein [Spirochaetes bacterium]|nr:GAF domain-containing protein [Spirochaetota bacterium]